MKFDLDDLILYEQKIVEFPQNFDLELFLFKIKLTDENLKVVLSNDFSLGCQSG